MFAKRAQRKIKKQDAELDITSFMNLMIVLVPVLLMMMVFSRITVVELKLPGIEALESNEAIQNQSVELLVQEDAISVFFPQGYLVKKIEKVVKVNDLQSTQEHDYEQLQSILKQIKGTLLAQGIEKKDLTLLLQKDTDYQTIVSLIDTTRSYKDVLIASVVDAELFPDVSLAEAPATYPIKPLSASQPAIKSSANAQLTQRAGGSK